MKLSRKVLFAAAGAAGGLVILVGSAMAGSPGQGGSPVVACKNKSTRAVRIVQSASSCSASETSVSWNKPGMTWANAFSTAVSYQPGQVVSYSGAVWINTAASHAAVPYVGSTYWSELATPGAPGKAGNQGPPGPVGNAGSNGTFTQQSGTLAGPVAIGSRIDWWKRIATMTIHSAYPSRPYSIFVKLDAYDWYDNPTNVSCRLVANNDSDLATVTLYNDNELNDYQPIALNVVHTFTPADNVVALDCAANKTNANVENVAMTAISGSQIINTPIN